MPFMLHRKGVCEVKVAALTRCDDSNMTMEDLAEGSQLLMVMNKKSYPITVQKVISALNEVSTVGRKYDSAFAKDCS